jgi:nanoRNase/pAp phosphatase (c-di-AMP/oligoRNAs hydrolase)
MLYKEELLEISDKFNGIILKKAEVSKNFEVTYVRVLNFLQKIESIDDIKVFEILGEFGG